MTRFRRSVLGIVVAATVATSVARAGELDAGNRKLFVKHCASCHGEDAKGGGVAASTLTTPPPDLTRLARDNGGEFPLQRVMRVIDGRDLVRPHGSRDMPVWGEVFAADYADPFRDQYGVRTKVRRLAEYVRSIQQPGK